MLTFYIQRKRRKSCFYGDGGEKSTTGFIIWYVIHSQTSAGCT